MAVPKREEHLVLFDSDDKEDDLSVLEQALSEDEKKCPPAEVDGAMGDEIHTMLDKFGDAINISLLKKRRRLQTYSETVSKKSSYKMKQVCETKQQQMLEVNNKYHPQFMDLFKQWDLEKQKHKEQQENLINVLQQQQMMLREYKIKRNQRMKQIIQMLTKYIQALKNIEDKYNKRCTASFVALKNEVTEYQKKYMMETQKQEIANIRKSLHSILFS